MVVLAGMVMIVAFLVACRRLQEVVRRVDRLAANAAVCCARGHEQIAGVLEGLGRAPDTGNLLVVLRRMFEADDVCQRCLEGDAKRRAFDDHAQLSYAVNVLRLQGEGDKASDEYRAARLTERQFFNEHGAPGIGSGGRRQYPAARRKSQPGRR